MRVGMALPVTLNLPFSQIDGAALRHLRQWLGRHSAEGDEEGARLPTCCCGRMRGRSNIAHPQPCLRCVARADDVASLLAAALAGAAPAPHGRRREAATRAASASQPVAA